MHKRFLCDAVSNNGDRRGVRLFLFFLIAINLSIRAERFHLLSTTLVPVAVVVAVRTTGAAAVPTARLLQQIQRLNLSTLLATVHHLFDTVVNGW